MRIRKPGFRIGAAVHVAFSSTGRLLAQVGRRVVIHDVATGNTLLRSQWHYPHAAYATFGAGDAWAAIRSTTGAIAVLELPGGDPLSRLPPTNDVADDSPLMAGPTGEHVVEACISGTLRVRTARTLVVNYVERHPADMLSSVSASADLNTWAIAFNRRQLADPTPPPCRIEIRRWPLSTGTRRTLGDRFGHVEALALAPDGRRVAVLERRNEDGRPQEVLSIISVRTGAVEQQAVGLMWRGPYALTWAPSQDRLVVVTTEGHALLEPSTLGVVGRFPGKYCSDAAFSPDGQLLALGYWTHGIVIPTADLQSWFPDSPSGASDPPVRGTRSGPGHGAV